MLALSFSIRSFNCAKCHNSVRCLLNMPLDTVIVMSQLVDHVIWTKYQWNHMRAPKTSKWAWAHRFSKNSKIVKLYEKFWKKLEPYVYKFFTLVQILRIKWHFMCSVQKDKNKLSEKMWIHIFANADFVFFTLSPWNVIWFW